VGTVVIVVFSRQLKLAKLKKPHIEWSINNALILLIESMYWESDNSLSLIPSRRLSWS
jgi:hypothetical protein